MSILIHKWRGYKKAKTFTTYGCVSVFGEDVFDMFDRAARRMDISLGYKKQRYEQKL